MLRKLALGGFVAAVVLAISSPAWGHGGPPETFTDIAHGVTESFPDVNPCTGDPGLVTITYNGVFHVTAFDDGHYHLTGTQTGTVDFDTTDPALPDYSGRFTVWFGENNNPNGFNGTFTFSVRVTGTDGSSLVFHETAHITIVGTEVIVEFDNTRCG